ncbi:MAG TPA: hypothetical protein VK524_26985 [Polyangiaceae bacterium]|nr:hypothetical protein [Polyangiaceae bacterium]
MAGGSGGAGGAGAALPGTVVDGQGRLNCEAYRKLAADYPAFIEYLNGPAYAAFHPSGGTAPSVFDRSNGGRYCYEACEANAVDWTGYSGQVLHLEDGPGVSRTRFIWSKHTGHGGTQFAHLYYLAPVNNPQGADSDAWYTSVVDPSVDVAAWKAANGGARLSKPVAIGRGRVTWSNNAILAFHGGLVGAVGSGNSSDQFPFAKLGPNEVPTDVALTNNSEFAFVTVWNTSTCSGRVAIFAPTQRDGFLPGLPNAGFFSALKLLGYVDLPFGAPTRLSVSVDFAQWMSSPSKDAQAELATQSGRNAWTAGTDEAHSAAKAGFALVASRDENKVAAIDLQPLIAYYRSMYFGTQQNYDQTKNLGPAANEWPFSFATAEAAKPKLQEVLDVSRPSVVITGFPVGDRSFTDAKFAVKAYVGTLDGELRAYDAGGLASDAAPTALELLGTRPLCKNPTRVDYGRGGKSRDGLAFACRGDRKVLFVDGGGTMERTLEDSRLDDPVGVSLGDSRGASVVSVANFSSRKLLNYLTTPVDAWGAAIFGGLGADGTAQFEFTGGLELSGKPFDVSSAEVP